MQEFSVGADDGVKRYIHDICQQQLARVLSVDGLEDSEFEPPALTMQCRCLPLVSIGKGEVFHLHEPWPVGDKKGLLF